MAERSASVPSEARTSTLRSTVGEGQVVEASPRLGGLLGGLSGPEPIWKRLGGNEDIMSLCGYFESWAVFVMRAAPADNTTATRTITTTIVVSHINIGRRTNFIVLLLTSVQRIVIFFHPATPVFW